MTDSKPKTSLACVSSFVSLYRCTGLDFYATNSFLARPSCPPRHHQRLTTTRLLSDMGCRTCPPIIFATTPSNRRLHSRPWPRTRRSMCQVRWSHPEKIWPLMTTKASTNRRWTMEITSPFTTTPSCSTISATTRTWSTACLASTKTR